MLNRPGHITVDDSGDIFVGDWGNHRILRFNSVGDWKQTFGREGSGPGEIRAEIPGLGGIALWPNQTLAVTDSRQSRLVLFNIDTGASIATVNLPVGAVQGPIHSFNSGKVVLQKISFGDASRVIALDSDLSPVDTLSAAPFNPWQSTSVTPQVWMPYYPQQVWTMDRQRNVIVGNGSDYAFSWYSENGSLIRTLQIDWIGQDVTATDRQDIRLSILNSRYTPPHVNRAIADELMIPDRVPPTGRIFVDKSQRLWVEHFYEARLADIRDYYPYRYDIFDVNLNPIGLVEFSQQVEHVEQDRVFWVSRSDEGATVIAVGQLRIPK